MMTPSHLAATLVVGLLLSRLRPWGRKEWGLALGFGVVVDLDHALRAPAYVAEAVAAGTPWPIALHPATLSAWGAEWQGIMHTPAGAVVVAAASLLAGRRAAWLPAAFWGLHMFQDFVIAKHFVRFGSPTEVAIFVGLFGIAYALWRWAPAVPLAPETDADAAPPGP